MAFIKVYVRAEDGIAGGTRNSYQTGTIQSLYLRDCVHLIRRINAFLGYPNKYTQAISDIYTDGTRYWLQMDQSVYNYLNTNGVFTTAEQASATTTTPSGYTTTTTVPYNMIKGWVKNTVLFLGDSITHAGFGFSPSIATTSKMFGRLPDSSYSADWSSNEAFDGSTWQTIENGIDSCQVYCSLNQNTPTNNFFSYANWKSTGDGYSHIDLQTGTFFIDDTAISPYREIIFMSNGTLPSPLVATVAYGAKTFYYLGRILYTSGGLNQTLSYTTNVDTTNNLIKSINTTTYYAGQPIQFKTTNLSNITANTIYYVGKITSGTSGSFAIYDTYAHALAGGDTLTGGQKVLNSGSGTQTLRSGFRVYASQYDATLDNSNNIIPTNQGTDAVTSPLHYVGQTYPSWFDNFAKDFTANWLGATGQNQFINLFLGTNDMAHEGSPVIPALPYGVTDTVFGSTYSATAAYSGTLNASNDSIATRTYKLVHDVIASIFPSIKIHYMTPLARGLSQALNANIACLTRYAVNSPSSIGATKVFDSRTILGHSTWANTTIFNADTPEVIFNQSLSASSLSTSTGLITVPGKIQGQTITASMLPNGTPIRFLSIGGALPTGVNANTIYFVGNAANSGSNVTFKIYSDSGITTQVIPSAVPSGSWAMQGPWGLIASVASNTITTTQPHFFAAAPYAGMPVAIYNIGGTAPGGTTVGTVYYAGNLGTVGTSTTLQLYNSRANAITGDGSTGIITLSSSGTGYNFLDHPGMWYIDTDNVHPTEYGQQRLGDSIKTSISNFFTSLSATATLTSAATGILNRRISVTPAGTLTSSANGVFNKLFKPTLTANLTSAATAVINAIRVIVPTATLNSAATGSLSRQINLTLLMTLISHTTGILNKTGQLTASCFLNTSATGNLTKKEPLAITAAIISSATGQINRIFSQAATASLGSACSGVLNVIRRPNLNASLVSASSGSLSVVKPLTGDSVSTVTASCVLTAKLFSNLGHANFLLSNLFNSNDLEDN